MAGRYSGLTCHHPLEAAAKAVSSHAEKDHEVIRTELGCYGCAHRRQDRDEGNLAIEYCCAQMRTESEKVLVAHLASHGDECQLTCGVEKGSWAEMTQWREDVALVAVEVAAEGGPQCGQTMASSCCCCRCRWNHSAEEISRGEEHVAPGKEYVTPSEGSVAMAGVGR